MRVCAQRANLVDPGGYQPPLAMNDEGGLLRELVDHLRENRAGLRQEWARRITDAKLLTAMTPEEVFSEATSVYDNYVEVLETGSVEALQAYARDLSERVIPRGVETEEVLGIVLLLRDVLARSLFEKYQSDFDLLNRVLDAYEPAANRIANTVGVSFVEERERIIRQQQEAIFELSTPVLQVRERLLILPIIGALDGARATQLTQQLLGRIYETRARVVVIDVTGVAQIDWSGSPKGPAPVGDEIATAIRDEADIMVARRLGRDLASQLNLSITDLTLIATAVSEVARNILTYAGEGEIRFEAIEQQGRRGILVTASDRGPGIVDIPQAMQDGYSRGAGLGLGLPGSTASWTASTAANVPASSTQCWTRARAGWLS